MKNKILIYIQLFVILGFFIHLRAFSMDPEDVDAYEIPHSWVWKSGISDQIRTNRHNPENDFDIHPEGERMSRIVVSALGFVHANFRLLHSYVLKSVTGGYDKPLKLGEAMMFCQNWGVMERIFTPGEKIMKIFRPEFSDCWPAGEKFKFTRVIDLGTELNLPWFEGLTRNFRGKRTLSEACVAALGKYKHPIVVDIIGGWGDDPLSVFREYYQLGNSASPESLLKFSSGEAHYFPAIIYGFDVKRQGFCTRFLRRCSDGRYKNGFLPFGYIDFFAREAFMGLGINTENVARRYFRYKPFFSESEAAQDVFKIYRADEVVGARGDDIWVTWERSVHDPYKMEGVHEGFTGISSSHAAVCALGYCHENVGLLSYYVYKFLHDYPRRLKDAMDFIRSYGVMGLPPGKVVKPGSGLPWPRGRLYNFSQVITILEYGELVHNRFLDESFCDWVDDPLERKIQAYMYYLEEFEHPIVVSILLDKEGYRHTSSFRRYVMNMGEASLLDSAETLNYAVLIYGFRESAQAFLVKDPWGSNKSDNLFTLPFEYIAKNVHEAYMGLTPRDVFKIRYATREVQVRTQGEENVVTTWEKAIPRQGSAEESARKGCKISTAGMCCSHAVVGALEYCHGRSDLLASYLHKAVTGGYSEGMHIKDAMQFVQKYGIMALPAGQKVRHGSGLPWPSGTKYMFSRVIAIEHNGSFAGSFPSRNTRGGERFLCVSATPRNYRSSLYKWFLRRYNQPLVIDVHSGYKDPKGKQSYIDFSPFRKYKGRDHEDLPVRYYVQGDDTVPEGAKKTYHAILLYGYRESTQRFFAKNSWGPKRNKGLCTLPFSYIDRYGREAFIGYGRKNTDKVEEPRRVRTYEPDQGQRGQPRGKLYEQHSKAL